MRIDLKPASYLRLSLLLVVLVARPARTRVIDLDWSTKSNLFDNGYHTTTVFARLTDLLRFRCSAELHFQIHLMKAVDALACLVGPTESSSLIGFCGPNTSDPRLALRSFSLMPNQPTFQVGEAYYFVAVGNTSHNTLSSELCDNFGMRLKVQVMAKNAEVQIERVEEETKKLLLREQQKVDLELIHDYNKRIHLNQMQSSGRVDEMHDERESERDSYEDNQSTPEKHTRRKSHHNQQHQTDEQLSEVDYSGRGRVHGQRHNGEKLRSGRPHHSDPNLDPPLQFRPIASDPYSLPSRTIGYDYVIGYEESNGAFASFRSFRVLFMGCALLASFWGLVR